MAGSKDGWKAEGLARKMRALADAGDEGAREALYDLHKAEDHRLCVDEYDDGADQDAVGTCSICDAVGHGYPGGGPCPLEERGEEGVPWWAQ